MDMNKPVAWMDENENVIFEKNWAYPIPLYTQDQLEEARKLGMQQERALWNLAESTQEFESFDRTASHMAGEYVTHPIKELKNIVVASATCSCGKVMEVTNLQPVKELTDEEITELENALKACDYKYFGSYAFTDKQWDAFEVLEKHAKAILRKAQK